VEVVAVLLVELLELVEPEVEETLQIMQPLLLTELPILVAVEVEAVVLEAQAN
jgi:hypothetical protein